MLVQVKKISKTIFLFLKPPYPRRGVKKIGPLIKVLISNTSNCMRVVKLCYLLDEPVLLMPCHAHNMYLLTVDELLLLFIKLFVCVYVGSD